MVFGETTQTDHSDEEAVNEVECVYVMYMRPTLQKLVIKITRVWLPRLL